MVKLSKSNHRRFRSR